MLGRVAQFSGLRLAPGPRDPHTLNPASRCCGHSFTNSKWHCTLCPKVRMPIKGVPGGWMDVRTPCHGVCGFTHLCLATSSLACIRFARFLQYPLPTHFMSDGFR